MRESDATFEFLTNYVRTKAVAQGTLLMEEGEDGDLFYIILDGTCTVLKAASHVIHYLEPGTDRTEVAEHYFQAFLENYEHI